MITATIVLRADDRFRYIKSSGATLDSIVNIVCKAEEAPVNAVWKIIDIQWNI